MIFIIIIFQQYKIQMFEKGLEYHYQNVPREKNGEAQASETKWRMKSGD